MNPAPRRPASIVTFRPLQRQLSFTLEIIPQAVSVRYGLSIGARCVPLVLALMYLLGSLSSNLLIPT